MSLNRHIANKCVATWNFCSYFFYTSMSWHSTYVDTANYKWQPATILHLINQLYLQSGLGLDPLARSLLAFFDDIGYWGWWARYLGSGGGGRGIAARMAIQGWKIFYQNGMFWKSRLTYKARSKYIEQKKFSKLNLFSISLCLCLISAPARHIMKASMGRGWEWRDWGGNAVQKLGAGSQRSYGLMLTEVVSFFN